MHVEELDRDNQGEARSLILAGLAEHWGVIDETLNPELGDMIASFRAGRTVLIRDDAGAVIGTGTLMPHAEGVAEILRMSVANGARRRGVGRRIVDELLATAAKWGAEIVVLETTSSWNEVIEFYLRCGFTITHVEDGVFGRDTWFEKRLALSEGDDRRAIPS